MPRPQARVADESNVRAQKDGSFNRDWTFPENAITYFYLFPPWGNGTTVNPRNLLAREVREIFLGRGKGSWTCWMSYQLHPQAAPDIGRKDIVTSYIFDAYRDLGKPEFVKGMLPRRKYYANILLDGYTPLGPDGQPAGETARFDNELWNKVVTARIPVGVYKQLMDWAMDKRLGAPFYLPDSAAMIAVQRTGKDLDTDYKTGFAEGSQQQGLFIPVRHDLYQERGEEVISELIGDPMGSSLPDLDTTEYPFPGDLDKMNADAVEFLKVAKLAVASGGGGSDGPPGGVEGVAPSPQGIHYGPPTGGPPAPNAGQGAPPVGAPPGPAQQPAPPGPAPAAQPQPQAPQPTAPPVRQPAPAPQPAPQQPVGSPAAQPAPQYPQPTAPVQAPGVAAPAPQQQPVGPPPQQPPAQTAPPPVGPPPTTVAAPGYTPPAQPAQPQPLAPAAGTVPQP